MVKRALYGRHLTPNRCPYCSSRDFGHYTNWRGRIRLLCNSSFCEGDWSGEEYLDFSSGEVNPPDTEPKIASPAEVSKFIRALDTYHPPTKRTRAGRRARRRNP